MPKQSLFKQNHRRRPTFFKKWRKHRRLTQQEVADRIRTTKTRVSMKENGKEPYCQDYLEALADALQTDPGSLLMRDPKQGEGMWSIWEKATQTERELIERVVRSIPIGRNDNGAFNTNVTNAQHSDMARNRLGKPARGRVRGSSLTDDEAKEQK